MKLGRGRYRNFASYKELDFDYADSGLTLFSGPTGAGKSTLMDAVAWCLFGITSKEGDANDVLQWGSDEPTIGTQIVKLSTDAIIVTRIRSKKSGVNDLYWTENEDTEEHRGKDVRETQILLEKKLNVNGELYCMAAYLTQFSKADSFFLAKAKERRDTLEKIADLSLPAQISAATTDRRREAKKGLESLQMDSTKLEGALSASLNQRSNVQKQLDLYDSTKAKKLHLLSEHSAGFEAAKAARIRELKAQIDQIVVQDDQVLEKTLAALEFLLQRKDEAETYLNLASNKLNTLETKHSLKLADFKKFSKIKSGVCPHCLGPTDNEHRKKTLLDLSLDIENLEEEIKQAKSDRTTIINQLSKYEDIESKIDKLQKYRLDNKDLLNQKVKLEANLRVIEAETNPYEAELAEVEKQGNPYIASIEQLDKMIYRQTKELEKVNSEIKVKEHMVMSLAYLYDLSLSLRGVLLEQAIKELEQKTNDNLQQYFDGAIQVKFELDEDKVEVEITKNGYQCGFKQLSGGQRQMLKLAFAVPLMEAAANKAGIHFGELFFDEPLNGLSKNLKQQAFQLFQNLATEHDSVFLIEHDEEFKTLFDNQYQVTLVNDNSEVTKL